LLLVGKILNSFFITEPAPSTSDENPASEPMETEQPEPEPEPEVDASVQKVCNVIIPVMIMSFPVFQNFVMLVRNEIKYYRSIQESS